MRRPLVRSPFGALVELYEPSNGPFEFILFEDGPVYIRAERSDYLVQLLQHPLLVREEFFELRLAVLHGGSHPLRGGLGL